jgi:multimeric flavodoxin WrbA
MLKSKVLLFNASPRKNGNTMKLLKAVKEGAESANAEAKIVHLYDLNFKGCVSCLECKKKGFPGGCFMEDDLTKYLKEAYDVTGLAIGTPIYIGNFSSSYYALYERLLYSNRTYEKGERRIKFGKRINTGLVVTAGVDKARFEKEYTSFIQRNRDVMTQTLGPCTVVSNIYQVLTPNTKPYDMGSFDMDAIHKWVKEHDPAALEEAFKLGVRLAQKI